MTGRKSAGEQVESLLKQLDPSGRENEAETDRRRKLVGAALADEREKSEATAERCRREIGEVSIAAAKVAKESLQLREQLAAERYKYERSQEKVKEYFSLLAAERENKTKRDGNWIDGMGACKVCDGEIPHGHTNNCDIWKLEQQLAAEREKLESIESINKSLAQAVDQLRSQLAAAQDKLAVTNSTIDFYERRELEYIKELNQLRDQLTALDAVKGDE